MSLSEQILLLRNELQEAEDHINKLQSGRKASSSKARASLMKLKKGSHQLRGDIIKFQKELPVKSRVRKAPEQVNILKSDFTNQTSDAKLSQAEPDPEPVEEETKASTKKAKPKRITKKTLKE